MKKTMQALAVGLALMGMSAAAFAHSGIDCSQCDEWNKPMAPFNIYANTWYVGTAGLSAVLVTSPKGHVLIDGALPQSGPLIRKNIEALGFRMQDIRYILNSHPHFDHAGSIAELQQASGATVVASPHAAQVLRDGTPGTDDPQYHPTERLYIPKVPAVKEIADGEQVTLGPLRFTVHYTPGHTPGGTTWTWQSCEKGTCMNMVYADSLTPVSTDGFYFSGGAGYPERATGFHKTIERVANLKCDIVVAAHPSTTDLFGKAAAKRFVDPEGCRKLAAGAMRNLDARLERERDEKAKAAAN